jgi:carboxyl-terminal processing protease
VIEIPSFYFDYRSRRAGTEYRSVSEDTAKAFESLKAQKVEGVWSIYVMTQVVH